jgi:hypothetical protein
LVQELDWELSQVQALWRDDLRKKGVFIIEKKEDPPIQIPKEENTLPIK